MRYFSIILFIAGVCLFGKSSYMAVKAELAQQLISFSWHTRESRQPSVKPWPWADIHAIAKIEVPRLGVVQYIMNDSSGEALAFGPGHLSNSTLPAEYGHSMIAGHRDSHFDFLQHLKLGDEIRVSNYLGRQRSYIIVSAYQLDTRTEELMMFPDHHSLTLITCFPFNKLANRGPLRWVVDAVPVKPESLTFN